jgi:hypothetical protein
MSPAESVPVWSTTLPDSGGTATSAWAAKAQHTRGASRNALAAIIAGSSLPNYFAGASAAHTVHSLRIKSLA